MAKLIELPNGEVAEFPDDMPDSDIEAALRWQPSSAAPSRSTGVLKADAAQPWQVPVAQRYPQGKRPTARAPRGGNPMLPLGSQRNPFPSRRPLADDGRPVEVPDGSYYYGKGGKVEQRNVGTLEAILGVIDRTVSNAAQSFENLPSALSSSFSADVIGQGDAFGGQWVGDVFIPATPERRQEAAATLGDSLLRQGQVVSRYDLLRRNMPKTQDRVALEQRMAADNSVIGTVGALWDDKANAAGLLTESFGASAPAIAVSALTQNPYALMAINGASGYQQEMSNGMTEYLDAQGIPREQWASLPEDVMLRAVDHAQKRAIVVGGAGALSGRLAGTRLVGPRIASTPARAAVPNTAAQSLLGATIDGAGEDIAQRLGNLPYSPQSTVLEVAGGALSQPVEALQSTIESAKLAGRSFVEVAPSADLVQMVNNPATPQEQRLEAALELMNRGESMPEADPQAVAAQVDAGTVAPEQAAQLLGQQVERQAASEGALASTLAQAVQTPQEPVQAAPLASDNPTAGDAFDTRLGEVARQIDERVANLERQAAEIKQAQTPQAQPASDFGDLLNAPASSLLDILNRNPQSLGDIVGVPADDQTDILTAIARQVAAQTDQQPAPMADLSPAGGAPVVGQPIAQGRNPADTPLYGTGIDRGEQGEVTNESRFLEENMRSWAQSRADAGNPERNRSGQPIRVQDIRITELPRRSLFNSLAIALDVAEQTLVGPGRRIAVITDEGSAAPLWFDGVYQGNTLYLNATADKPLVTVAAHEFVHSLKQSDPDLYARLEAYVEQYGDETGHSAAFGYNREPGYTRAKGVEELTANLTGDALSDRAFLEGMAKREPSLFRDLAERFIDYLDELLAVFGRQKDSGVSKYVKDVQAFRDLLADVLVEKAKRNQTKGDVLALADEIGWAQEGGKLIARNGMDEGVNGEGGGLQVTGRTTWEPKARSDGGGMSNFWQMRPGDNPGEGAKISERAARLALKKYTNGEKLTAQERRFIEYAEKTAAEYRGERDMPFSRKPEVSESRIEEFRGMSRDDFLGSPRITANDNASDLKPRELPELKPLPAYPFLGRYTAKYSDGGTAVFDGDKVIASYNFGDTLVVDKKYRRLGIAEELVYQWRTRNPGPAIAKTRTKASQAIQEKVWERIQNELSSEQVDFSRRIEQLIPEATPQEQVKAAEADKDAKRNGNPQARSDMMAGDGELFAGERPEQGALFSRRPEDVVAEGRLLSLIDAAKNAGIDLSPLRKAHTDNDGEAVKRAIADILAKLNKPMRSTGTKNAVTDAEREAAGRSPILRDMAKTNEATVYEAIRTVKSDPFAGPEAISRLNRAGSEGISLEDEAVLLVYKTELMNKRDAAADKLADPKASEAVKDAARIAWEEAEAGIEAIDQASVNAGREWGRFGQFRQRMMKADFTLEAMERKERARLERPLTASEAVTIKAMADTIAELQKKVDILQERVANAASESAYDAMTRAMAKPMRQRKSLDYLRNAANDARARLNATKSVPSRRGQSGAIISPSVFYDYAVIGAYHIANGAAKFSDWVSAMRADLGQLFDEIKADHPNIFKASQKELERPLKADVTVEDVMAGIDFANIKPKDVRKLIEALVGEGLRGEPAVIGAASEKLGLSEDEVRALFVQTEPKGPQTLDEARQELSDLRKLVRLQNEIDRLEAGRPKPERNQQAEDSPEVASRKQELADLRKRLRPVVDPEQRYQELRGKQIEKRIADLQARIERGDFTNKPRIPRPLNEANQRAMFELDKAKEDFLRYQYLESLKARSKWGKAIGFVGDSFNLSRAVMTSIDLSGLLRQGGFITLGRPITGLRAFFGTLPTLFSERAEHRVMNDLKSRPNAPLYLKYKLALTNIGSGPLSRVEEAYAARWLDKVESVEGQPIRNAARKVKNVALAPVRGSGRAYAAFLSRLRADAFDAMAATMTKTGVPTEAEAKWIVDFVNTATGRAKIWGKSDNPGEIINTLAFAPRLVVSRLSLATATPVWTAPSGRAKKLAAMEYARFLTGVAVVSSLLAYAFDDEDDDQEYGDHFTFDPRSSDFMKLRFGNTRIDPFTGLSQVSVMLSRLATGETVNAKGEVKPIRPKWTLTDLRRLLGEDIPAHEGITDEGKLAFGERNAVGVISSFLRSKLAPIPGAAVNLIAGSDFKGDPITIQEQAQALAMPMSFGDIADAMEENGVPRGTAMSMLALLGMSMQVQTPSNKQQFAEFRDNLKAVRTDVKERLSQRPVEEWPDAMEEMKREYGPVLEGIELDYYKSDGKYGNAGEPKRDRDGNPVLKSERLSEREKYDDGIDGTQVHHIIPDNLVRSHPLMAAARKAGYDLDNPQNLISMPDKNTDGEIAHNTEHPNYDAEVYGQLQDAVKRLKKEYGSLDEAPADALLDEVRKVEEAMRDRLKRKDVPTKDGRLAVNGRSMVTGA